MCVCVWGGGGGGVGLGRTLNYWEENGQPAIGSSSYIYLFSLNNGPCNLSIYSTLSNWHNIFETLHAQVGTPETVTSNDTLIHSLF